MIYIARLGTAEGDMMEIRHQSRHYTTWGPDGTMGRNMAGREESWNYANDIGIFVNLSEQRGIPLKILAEISSRPASRYVGGYDKKKYELNYIGERSFFCETSDRVVISGVRGNELQHITYDQYINFTLIYEEENVPLFDPVNGELDFRMTLEWAEEISEN